MRVRIAAAGLAAAAMLTCAACSMRGSGGSGDLKPGMTPDQAVAALGQPDLKDRVVDPHHHGVELMRFVWLDTGKVAMFGPNNQLAKVDSIAPASPQNGASANAGASTTDAAAASAATTKVETPQEVQREVRPQPAFDPIETPMSYLFWPVRAAFYYVGAGLNCVGGAGCAPPDIPGPRD